MAANDATRPRGNRLEPKRTQQHAAKLNELLDRARRDPAYGSFTYAFRNDRADGVSSR